LYAASWGAVGGILRGLWFLKEKVSERKYNNSFRIYFLCVPFLGGLFGAIMYFLLLAGVLIVGAELPTSHQTEQIQATTVSNQSSHNNTSNSTLGNQPAVGPTATTVSSWTIVLFAVLAGFNWEWALILLKRIGDTFKEVAEPNRKMEK
jgi:hypothetical protein